MIVVCSGALLITTTVTVTFTSVDQSTSGEHGVVLSPQVILRDTVRVLLVLFCRNNNLISRCLLRHKPTMPWVLCRWVSLSESSLPPIHFLYVGVCYGVCSLLSGSHVAVVFTNGGSSVGVCSITTLQCTTLVGVSASWWWSMAHTRSALSGCFSHCFK